MRHRLKLAIESTVLIVAALLCPMLQGCLTGNSLGAGLAGGGQCPLRSPGSLGSFGTGTSGGISGPLAPVTGLTGSGSGLLPTKAAPTGVLSPGDSNSGVLGGAVQPNAAVLDIAVQGGYQPSSVTARAGQPVSLRFTRQESSGCGAEVVFPSLGKSASLPQGQPVAVDLPALPAGRYEFTCGMGMYRGTLVVQ